MHSNIHRGREVIIMAEIRRIVRHGGGCSVNLPRRMCNALELRIGDHVTLEIVDEKLVVVKLNMKGIRTWDSESIGKVSAT